ILLPPRRLLHGPLFILVPLSKSLPRLRSFLTSLRTSTPPDLPMGAAGYCWGAKHIIALSSEFLSNSAPSKSSSQRPLLDAAFVAHPASNVVVPDDFERLVTPLSMAVAGEDIFFPMEVVEKVKGVLGRQEDEGKGRESEVVVYVGAKHVFATRGDDKVGFERRQAEEAREQAVGWLGKWFVKGRGGSG
ncbi:MAG: hypothetical protein Q9180_007218, partial [Flavoplaca navasiana]